jgi:hypothetical protein
MPNRILREGILTSERVNVLSWPAEVFYRRLMSAVDDFGRYWGKSELLRAGLYPLLLDRVGNPDVVKWLAECADAGLVRTYTVEGKEYVQLLDFRQQVRAAKSKFPEPSSASLAEAKQLRSTRAASAHVVGVVDGCEDGGGTSAGRSRDTAQPDGFDLFWTTYPKRIGNNPKDRALKAYRARVKEGHKPAEILDGAGRYAEFCRVSGKLNTEFVMQAATFLGPGKGFEQKWEGSSGISAPDYSALVKRLEEEERHASV